MSDPGADYRFATAPRNLITEIDGALHRGEIDEAGWHARVADILRPRISRRPTPQAQSGFSGGPLAWEQARGLVADAMRSRWNVPRCWVREWPG